MFVFLEERCEPSMPFLRNTGTNRYCPDINTWNDFDQYEIGDGFGSQTSTSAPRYPDRNRYNTINREGDRRMRPPPFEPDRVNDY